MKFLYSCFFLFACLSCLHTHAQEADSLTVVRGDSAIRYKLVVVHDTVYVPIPEAQMPVDSSRIIRTTVVSLITVLSPSTNGLVVSRFQYLILKVTTAVCCSPCSRILIWIFARCQ